MTTSLPIAPASLDHAALLQRFWRPAVTDWDRKRRQAVFLAANGVTGYRISYLLGVPRRTVYNWILADRQQEAA